MVHGKNRMPYRIDRRLTGLAGPDDDATISFGLPFEPEDSQYGESWLTPKRDARAAEIVMRKAKAVAANPPVVIRSDKLPSYIPAIKKVFDDKTKHLQSEGLAADVNNNLSERMQGSIRERDKVLRAMKSRESGQNYLDGWSIDYNLFRPHLGLGERTPAQAPGMVVPFTSWQDVAQKVTPIVKPNREEWQTRDEHINADRSFQVMDVAQTQEAAINKKGSSTGFRVRKGFMG